MYGLVLMIQDKEIKAHCFGDCGKVALAGIDSNLAGPLVPCRHDDCPWEEAKTPVVGQAFGEDLCIRKLREIEG